MKEEKIKIYYSYLIFLISTLIVYNFINLESFFEKIIGLLIFFVITPLISYIFILKLPLSRIPLSTSNVLHGYKWIILSIIFSLPIVYIIFNGNFFLDKYSIPPYVMNSFSNFLVYELLFVVYVSAVYEFFFRGMVFAIFKKNFGLISIFLSFALMGIFYITLGNANFYPYLTFSLFGALIAYKTNSIIYSFLGQILYIFLIDILFILKIS